jgi:hypothetical protein
MSREAWEPPPGETGILTHFREFDAVALLLRETPRSSALHKRLHDDLARTTYQIIRGQPKCVLDLAAQTVALMACGKLAFSRTEMEHCFGMLNGYITGQATQPDLVEARPAQTLWPMLLACIVNSMKQPA